MNDKKIEGIIFDFDGVITNTDLYHFIAWKRAVRIIDINMDPSVQNSLRGLTRDGTLEKILDIFNESISAEVFKEITEKKNNLYMEMINEITSDEVLPGIIDFLKYLKSHNYKTAIASVSANSEKIIKNLGLTKYFDVIVDPQKISHMKPAPDIFFAAAKELDISPWKCIGIEDSQVGIEAINSSFMQSICIDFHNELNECSLKLRSTIELNPETFLKFLDSIE